LEYEAVARTLSLFADRAVGNIDFLGLELNGFSLFSSIIVELYINILKKFLDFSAGNLISSFVLGANTQMQILIGFHLVSSFLVARALSSQSEFEKFVNILIGIIFILIA
jgi:hypothetical protein